jgi:replicative DNA helicase
MSRGKAKFGGKFSPERPERNSRLRRRVDFSERRVTLFDFFLSSLEYPMASSEKRSRSSKPKPDHNSIPVDFSTLPNVSPHNLEAERGVIGSLLLDPLLADDIVIMLSEDDFYSDANRRLYKHLKEMRSTGCAIDLELLLDRLRKAEEIEAIGGEAYIAELMSSHHIAAHAVYYAELVREKSSLRRLIHEGSAIVQEAFSPSTIPKDLINRAAQRMFDLCDSQTSNQVSSMYDVMMEATSYVDNMMHGEHDGIMTGFADLDERLTGLRPNELIILAARPGMGKTALGMNIAEHVAVDQQKPVLVVSLEMAKRELALRLICSRGRIDSYRIRKNFLSSMDLQQLQRAADEMSTAPMFFDDTPSRTISEIAAVARRLKRQSDLQLLVIDYLTLITPDNLADPRQEQVAKMARRLKGLARELHVPILCLAQLNRQSEMGGKEMEPKLSNLRESGAIEQDADVVLLIHRHKVKTTDEETEETKVIIAKNRAGATGVVRLVWQPEYTRFVSMAKQEQDDFNDFANEYGNDPISSVTEFSGESVDNAYVPEED